MKKVLALLLALVMVFALCACGDSTAPAADPTEAPAEATPEATEAHVVSEETAAQDVRPNTMIVQRVLTTSREHSLRTAILRSYEAAPNSSRSAGLAFSINAG